MSLTNEDSFAKLIKGELKDNIYLFYGEDDYLKDYYSGLLVSKTVDSSLEFFNLKKYEDADTEIEDIFADAETLPVMAEKRCSVIKNYPLLELNTKAVADFEKALANVPETSVMVFIFSSDKVSTVKNAKWDNIVKIFDKLGTVVKTDHRTISKTAKLLVSRAKDKGTSIDTDTALYLINCVGDDLQTVLNEFNKVCAFSQGQPVTKQMIDLTAVKSIEASVFDISESIFSGNSDRAFEILSELLKQKVQSSAIIGALGSAYVNAYRLKVALNADKGVGDFSNAYQYRETKYTFGKISAFTRKSSLKSIRNALDVLLKADVKSKSIKISDEMLLTELISELVSCAKE